VAWVAAWAAQAAAVALQQGPVAGGRRQNARVRLARRRLGAARHQLRLEMPQQQRLGTHASLHRYESQSVESGYVGHPSEPVSELPVGALKCPSRQARRWALHPLMGPLLLPRPAWSGPAILHHFVLRCCLHVLASSQSGQTSRACAMIIAQLQCVQQDAAQELEQQHHATATQAWCDWRERRTLALHGYLALVDMQARTAKGAVIHGRLVITIRDVMSVLGKSDIDRTCIHASSAT
jgi:hypothetical protein